MADDRPALQMTMQLQLAVRMLETPTAELGELIAIVPGLEIGEPDGDDPLLEPLPVGDDDTAEPWRFRDVLPCVTGDVCFSGDPPSARANRSALPRLRIVTRDRDVEFMLRALRTRARTYEAVARAFAQLRPQVATAQRVGEVEPIELDELAELAGLHASTIERVARGCRIETRHRVFALCVGELGIGLAD